MDDGRVPEQFGVVLRFPAGHGLDLDSVRALLAERVAAVARLRRRLVRTPLGCGGPVWVDDPGFDIGRHVHQARCPDPCDEPALMGLAWETTARRLSRDAALWSALLVSGLADGGAAVVLVLHHALADGIGGLVVLTDLVDPGTPTTETGFPRPIPSTLVLAGDAARRRLRAVRALGANARLLRASLSAGGGLRPPRAQPCSLLAATGPRRRALVLHTELADLRRAVHPRGATVNDALLVAVAGALHHVLARRGEALDRIVVAVPVSGRGPSQRHELGNMVTPLLVAALTRGSLDERLAAVSSQVRVGREQASGPPAIAVLGWLFRPLAVLGRGFPRLHAPPAPAAHPGQPRSRPRSAGQLRRRPDHRPDPDRGRR